MEDGSSSRRSWADEAEDELPSPRALGAGSPGTFLDSLLTRGPEGRISLSDLEYSDSEPPLSPLPAGKGKEVAEPSRKRRRVHRHHHHCRRPEGFMAAASRSHPSPSAASSRHRSSPASHPARALGSRMQRGPFRSGVAAAAAPGRRLGLRGRCMADLCVNCLAVDHIKVNCVIPAKCYNCWTKGHHAAACPFPPRRGAAGGKRGRSPSRALEERRVARRWSPIGWRSCASADTTSAWSASTGRSTSVP